MFTDGPATRAAAEEYQLEGLMAKRLTSVYRPGTRSPDWVKVKIDLTAEFVVGGWRPGARTLGALFIGVPTADGLAYRGRVGGGISAASERALLESVWNRLSSSDSPFVTDIPKLEAKGATWVRPGGGGRGAVRAGDAGRPAAVSPVPADPSGPDARRSRHPWDGRRWLSSASS